MKILHRTKALAACALTAALAIGCTEEQSSLEISDMPGKATIQGLVTYSEGTILENGKFKELMKPAAGKQVDILLNNADYQSTASGKTLYKTIKTDANGRFSLAVPVPVDGNVTATVRPHAFEGEFNTVERINNEIKAVKDTVYFYTTGQTLTLSSGAIKTAECEYDQYDSRDQVTTFNQYVTFGGVVGKQMEKYYAAVSTTIKEEGANKGKLDLVSAPRRVTYYDKMANADLLVNVTYYSLTRTYNCTTNANGEFSLSVPVNELPCTLTCKIEAMPVVSDYTFYEEVEKEWSETELAKWASYYQYRFPYTTDYKSKTVKGYYASSTVNSTFSYKVDQPQTDKFKMMRFVPTDGTEVSLNGALWLDELLEQEKNSNN